MGYVRVRCLVTNPENRLSEELEMLADTGSWYVVVPRTVADKLGLRIIGREKVTLADGREVEVDLAPIYIELLGRGTYALAAIIEAPEPILGTSVMEVLGLIIDPESGEIKKRRPKSSYMLLNLTMRRTTLLCQISYNLWGRYLLMTNGSTTKSKSKSRLLTVNTWKIVHSLDDAEESSPTCLKR